MREEARRSSLSQVVTRPADGFANRLKCLITSAIQDTEYRVLWRAESFCGLRFADIFRDASREIDEVPAGAAPLETRRFELPARLRAGAGGGSLSTLAGTTASRIPATRGPDHRLRVPQDPAPDSDGAARGVPESPLHRRGAGPQGRSVAWSVAVQARRIHRRVLPVRDRGTCACQRRFGLHVRPPGEAPKTPDCGQWVGGTVRARPPGVPRLPQRARCRASGPGARSAATGSCRCTGRAALAGFASRPPGPSPVVIINSIEVAEDPSYRLALVLGSHVRLDGPGEGPPLDR
jgi:hypothetical protein